ncbi:hypothetical protein XELAEV_18038575mg [Xenopus laevis]|uniref:Uncharacterized protein n=1 Tax=Xenopus laevis TaxID=8355 RepID=A0A974C7H6_XENLA|nr:hypothetical protein XELAEV_18038575mg [Xenopus laevis]
MLIYRLHSSMQNYSLEAVIYYKKFWSLWQIEYNNRCLGAGNITQVSRSRPRLIGSGSSTLQKPNQYPPA